MTGTEPVEPAEVAAPLIYENDHLVVRREEGRSDWTLVTFNESSMIAAGGRYWGQNFVRKNGLSALGFVTKAPNWFPMRATLEAIDGIETSLTEAHPRILYGHSMGAYAAIKFSAALKAETVIAFCPQHSIEPRHTGKFTLYTSYYTEENIGMKIDQADVAGKIYIFYDPCLEHDRFHVGKIAIMDGVSLIALRHTGHDTIRCFASSRSALELIDACRAGNRSALLRLAATRRRAFPERYRNVALAIAKRRPHLAIRILTLKAAGLAVSDIANIYASAGEGYFKRGDLVLAEHCISAATELDCRNVMHLLLRSAILMHTKRPAAALNWARQALAIAPDNRFVRERLVELERSQTEARGS